jgi:HlyD family secretion protein
MKKIFSILLGLAVVALFGGTLYFLWAKSRKPAVIYETESPKRSTIIKKAVATGSVLPREEVAIKPQISGIVEEVAVEAGAVIKKGDLIARIRVVPNMVSLANAQSRVEQARIALESAEREYRRSGSLFADGTIPQATAQQAETTWKAAQAELASARDNVDLIARGTSRSQGNTSNTLVRSTIDGMVLDVPIEVGNSVIESNTFNEGTTLATVARMDDMVFEGTVDESEVGKLRQGMALVLTIGAIQDKKLDATLEHVAPKGKAVEGAIQFEIRAALQASPDLFIRANYSANADVVLDRRDDVLAISEGLLRFDEGKTYVEVETAPQKFERRDIETGLSDGILIEVVSGLTESDKIKAAPAEPGQAAAPGGSGGQRGGGARRR